MRQKIIKIKDVMVEQVIAVGERATLEEITKLLVKHNISGVPVVSAEDKLLGVVSEKDLFRTIYPDFQDIITDVRLWLLSGEKLHANMERKKNVLARKMMTRRVLSVKPDDSILRCGSLMLLNDIHRFPVLDGQGRVVGIVTRRDIFRRLLKAGMRGI